MQSQEEFLNSLFELSVPLISLELDLDESRIRNSESLSEMDHKQIEDKFLEILEKYWSMEEKLKDSRQDPQVKTKLLKRFESMVNQAVYKRIVQKNLRSQPFEPTYYSLKSISRVGSNPVDILFMYSVLSQLNCGLRPVLVNHNNLLKKPYTSALLLPPIDSEIAEDILDEEEKEEETEPKYGEEKGKKNKVKEERKKSDEEEYDSNPEMIRSVSLPQSYCKFIPAESPTFDRLYYGYQTPLQNQPLKINFLKDFLELDNLERTTNAYGFLISTQKHIQIMERKEACKFIITSIEEVLSNPFNFEIEDPKCSKDYDPREESQIKISIIENLVNFSLALHQYAYIRFKWIALEKMKTIEVHINIDKTWSLIRLPDIPYKKEIFTADTNSVTIQVYRYDKSTDIRQELLICDLSLEEISPFSMKPSEEQQKINDIIAKYSRKENFYQNNEQFLPKLKLEFIPSQFRNMILELRYSFTLALKKAKNFIEDYVEKCPKLFEENTLPPKERFERLNLLYTIYDLRWKAFLEAFESSLK